MRSKRAVRLHCHEQLELSGLLCAFGRARDRIWTTLMAAMRACHHCLTRFKLQRLTLEIQCDEARPGRGCHKIDDRNCHQWHWWKSRGPYQLKEYARNELRPRFSGRDIGAAGSGLGKTDH